MSRRIRTLKPEILEDEKTAGLTDAEFRLFVSLILMSDDYGNFRAHEGYVHGVIYWSHLGRQQAETAVNMKKLESKGLVKFYEDAGQGYGHIITWSKHQKVDRPGQRRIPKYPGETGTSELLSFPREEVANDQGSGIRDQGSWTKDPICVLPDEKEGGIGEVFNEYLKKWLEFHSSKGGRPPLLSEARRKHISARVKEFGVSTCLNAVSGLFSSEFHMGKNDRQTTYLTPEHIFRSPEQMEKCLKFYQEKKEPQVDNLPACRRPMPRPGA